MNGAWTAEDRGSEQSDDNDHGAAHGEANKELVQHKTVMTADRCIAIAVEAMERQDYEVCSFECF